MNGFSVKKTLIAEAHTGGFLKAVSKKASKDVFVRIPKNVERKSIRVFRNGEEFHKVYDEKINRVVWWICDIRDNKNI